MTSLRHIVARGAVYSGAAVIVARAASLATQAVLGAVLSDGEWGTYATALSIATIFTGFRDGGVADLIAERGRSASLRSGRRVFGISAATNLLIASALIGVSWPAQRHFEQDAVAHVLWLTALSLILATPAAFARGVLRSQLNFAVLATMNSAGAVLRAVAAIGFGLGGFGAVSFALGLPAIALVESLVLWRAAGIGRLQPNRGVSTQDRSTRDAGWLLIAAAGAGVLVNGDYLVLSLTVGTATLGQYYFAYRLVSQATTVVTASLTPVLIPGLTKLRDDPGRLASRIGEVLLLLGVCLTPMSLLVAVNFDALDDLLWRGKWADAQIAVWCLSAVFPMRATFVVARSLLISQRRYRDVAFTSLALASGLLVVTAATAITTDDIDWIAAGVAAYLFGSVGVAHQVAMRNLDVALSRTLGALVLPLTLGLGSGAMTTVVGDVLSADLSPAWRLVARTFLFSVLYGIAVRIFASAVLPSLRAVVSTVTQAPRWHA